MLGAANPARSEAEELEAADAVERRVALGSLALLVLLSIYLLAIFGRFPHMDEVAYKAPGAELVTSGRYVLPEFTGFDITPPFEKVYALQFVYGLVTAGVISLFGLSSTSMLLMDGAIHGALVFLTFGLCRRLHPARSPWVALIAACAVLPLGTLGRADEAGMLLGYTGLLILLSGPDRWTRIIPAGALIALSAMAHPACSASLALVAIGYAFFRAPMPGEPVYWPRRSRFGTRSLLQVRRPVSLLAGTIAAILAFLAILEALPARGLLTQIVNMGDNYLHPVSVSRLEISMRFAGWSLMMTLGLALFGVLDRGLRRIDRRRWLSLWAGPLLFLAFWLALMPGRHFYLWYIGPWMIAAASGRAFASLSRWRPSWRTALFAGCVAIGMVPALHAGLILTSLPEDQGLRRNAEIVKRLVPPGSHVVTDDYWWSLGLDRTVYSASFSKIAPEQVDYVVATGNGSGAPGRPNWPLALLGEEDHFDLIFDDLNRQPLSLFGKRLTNSAWGFGVAIFRRKVSRAALESPKGNAPETPHAPTP